MVEALHYGANLAHTVPLHRLDAHPLDDLQIFLNSK